MTTAPGTRVSASTAANLEAACAAMRGALGTCERHATALQEAVEECAVVYASPEDEADAIGRAVDEYTKAINVAVAAALSADAGARLLRVVEAAEAWNEAINRGEPVDGADAEIALCAAVTDWRGGER